MGDVWNCIYFHNIVLQLVVLPIVRTGITVQYTIL